MSRGRTQNDHACRPISTLLILRPAEFNHIFGRRVSDVDLAKNSISVICETEKWKSFRELPSKTFDGRHSHNASHGVEDHLQHGFGP